MVPKVIPLRSRSDDHSALARIDVEAGALLSGEGAANLQAARMKVILKDLRLRRGDMTALLSDLRSRELTHVHQVDGANTNLIAAIVQGLVQIDLFIAQARGILEETEQPGASQSDASSRVLKGF